MERQWSSHKEGCMMRPRDKELKSIILNNEEVGIVNIRDFNVLKRYFLKKSEVQKE